MKWIMEIKLRLNFFFFSLSVAFDEEEKKTVWMRNLGKILLRSDDRTDQEMQKEQQAERNTKTQSWAMMIRIIRFFFLRFGKHRCSSSLNLCFNLELCFHARWIISAFPSSVCALRPLSVLRSKHGRQRGNFLLLIPIFCTQEFW